LHKFLLYISLFFTSFSYAQNTGNLILNFDNSFDKKGNFIVYMYNSEKGFPTKKELCYKKIVTQNKGQNQLIINNLKFNDYAIILVFDENENQKMDRNWLGLPAEKYALSGQPKFHFGPPVFNEVKFRFNRNNQKIFLAFN